MFTDGLQVIGDTAELVAGRLAGVSLLLLCAGLMLHVFKLGARARAWHHIVSDAYPDEGVRYRHSLGAYFAGIGVNAVVPVRSGELLKIALVKRQAPGTRYRGPRLDAGDGVRVRLRGRGDRPDRGARGRLDDVRRLARIDPRDRSPATPGRPSPLLSRSSQSEFLSHGDRLRGRFEESPVRRGAGLQSCAARVATSVWSSLGSSLPWRFAWHRSTASSLPSTSLQPSRVRCSSSQCSARQG